MTSRISLRPLRVDDAEQMAVVLGDPGLYEFTGGEPPTVDDLRRRYQVQTRGGPRDGSEQWVNLIVVVEPDHEPVGYVQATIPTAGGPTEIAWVIGAQWQGRGLATQAAHLLLEELRDKGVAQVIAHIHPEHVASVRVARKLGLEPTETVVDGEIQWVDDLA